MNSFKKLNTNPYYWEENRLTKIKRNGGNILFAIVGGAAILGLIFMISTDRMESNPHLVPWILGIVFALIVIWAAREIYKWSKNRIRVTKYYFEDDDRNRPNKTKDLWWLLLFLPLLGMLFLLKNYDASYKDMLIQNPREIKQITEKPDTAAPLKETAKIVPAQNPKEIIKGSNTAAPSKETAKVALTQSPKEIIKKSNTVASSKETAKVVPTQSPKEVKEVAAKPNTAAISKQPAIDLVTTAQVYLNGARKKVNIEDWARVVDRHLSKQVQLSEQQKAVVQLAAMRMGSRRFANSTFLKKVNSGDLKGATEWLLLQTADGKKIMRTGSEPKQYFYMLRVLWSEQISIKDLMDTPAFSYKALPLNKIYDASGTHIFNNGIQKDLSKGVWKTPRNLLI